MLYVLHVHNTVSYIIPIKLPLFSKSFVLRLPVSALSLVWQCSFTVVSYRFNAKSELTPGSFGDFPLGTSHTQSFLWLGLPTESTCPGPGIFYVFVYFFECDMFSHPTKKVTLNGCHVAGGVSLACA